uniref:glycine--tRNA ligase n=1 Tax=Albugo laibachii Nc14 TaxID=890382 RepID=F0VZ32_9STRA|nr:glycyltRNA synthetase putative [Albugo laibachii Nc14]|eukprot:CCA14047.1 glycyltRNA synthetase putative [Albugo laibachii Nc14]
MSSPRETNAPKRDLDALRAQVTRQGALVRKMKQDGGGSDDIKAAVDTLKALKIELDRETLEQQKSITLGLSKHEKKALDDVLIRKMFIVPSFEIYGGIGGFYDFGPPACALKANFLRIWRSHFVFEDRLLEVECTNLMPEIVLKTSGHVDRFTDLMVKCTKSGECYRADKLVEDHVHQLIEKNATMSVEEQEKHRLKATLAESYTPEELHAVIQEYQIKAPGTGADISDPIPFNLMFQCQIGPEGNQIGYLRPETAQGIFLNFRRLLEYNAGVIPFGCAQIGNAFRNEISPRGGLLRVREFQQAEIEYFVNPKDKNHPKFHLVANTVLPLLTKTHQLTDGKTVHLTCEEAVANGIIANQSLAYYLERTNLFAIKIGLDMERVRFRQHLDTEMSHYASDCWDLEVHLVSGWVECAGHADRSCYDLTVHSKKSKVELVGTHRYPEPEKRLKVEIKSNKGLLGRTFKSDAAYVNEALEELQADMDKALAFEQKLCTHGKAILELKCAEKQFTVTREMIQIKLVEVTVREEKYFPSVIEPSFGIGRILTAVFEHSFSIREGDAKRGVMAFKPCIAPIKVSVLPLSTQESLHAVAHQLESVFAQHHIVCRVDTSSVAIGRKYARADELGIPFNVTIDFETATDEAVTLRERDSCQQVRLPISDVVWRLKQLIDEKSAWSDMCAKYPVVGSSE